MSNKTMIIEVEEYESLVEDSEWLACLESAGVDNWSGYSYAQELLEDEDA